MNRSMGQPDFYPFVVSPNVIKKLTFVHTLLAEVKERKPSTNSLGMSTCRKGKCMSSFQVARSLGNDE